MSCATGTGFNDCRIWTEQIFFAAVLKPERDSLPAPAYKAQVIIWLLCNASLTMYGL